MRHYHVSMSAACGSGEQLDGRRASGEADGIVSPTHAPSPPSPPGPKRGASAGSTRGPVDGWDGGEDGGEFAFEMEEAENEAGEEIVANKGGRSA